MYNLVPRFPGYDEEEEDNEVGPTSYFVEAAGGTCKFKGPSFPFTSSSLRFKVADTEETPSPTQYYPKYRKYRVLGGKSLQYTTPRVCMVPKKKGPPPQSFDTFFSTSTSLKRVENGSIKKLLRRECSGVIPAELGPETHVILREASIKLPLPLYLTFPGEVSKVSLKYKGPRWAMYKTKRKGLEVETGSPGPAAYIIQPKSYPKKPAKEKHVERVQPPPCKPPTPKEKPGMKEISSQEEATKPTLHSDPRCDYCYNKVSHNKNPKGIWGDAQRFSYSSSNENPAPCAYSPGKVRCLRRVVKITPFESCVPRFKVPKKTDLSPATYNPRQYTLSQKICRGLPKFKGILRAPFGSTTPRLPVKPMPKYSDDDEDEEKSDQAFVTIIQVVKPASVKEEEKERNEKVEKLVPEHLKFDEEYYQAGPCFKFYEEEKDDLLVDIAEVYARYKNKTSHRKPKQNEGFLSATYDRSSWLERRTPAHNVNWPKELDDVKVIGGALKMGVPRHTTTVKPKEDDSVFYDVHPQFGSSVYRSTHNYRLKNDGAKPKSDNKQENVKYILKCFMPREILYA